MSDALLRALADRLYTLPDMSIVITEGDDSVWVSEDGGSTLSRTFEAICCQAEPRLAKLGAGIPEAGRTATGRLLKWACGRLRHSPPPFGLEDCVMTDAPATRTVALAIETFLADLERTAADVSSEGQRQMEATPSKRRAGRSRRQHSDTGLKLIAALTQHHGYASGGCLNLEPIGVRALASKAGVSPSVASEFFRKHFGNLESYRDRYCMDARKIGLALADLNKERSLCRLLGDAANELPAPEDE